MNAITRAALVAPGWKGGGGGVGFEYVPPTTTPTALPQGRSSPGKGTAHHKPDASREGGRVLLSHALAHTCTVWTELKSNYAKQQLKSSQGCRCVCSLTYNSHLTKSNIFGLDPRMLLVPCVALVPGYRWKHGSGAARLRQCYVVSFLTSAVGRASKQTNKHVCWRGGGRGVCVGRGDGGATRNGTQEK